MTSQHLPLGLSRNQTSITVTSLLAARSLPALALIICAATGLISVALGPDNNWDLRYYHYYAPWAYLHGRYLYDIGPAQSQGFLNPTADFLFYALTSSILNDTPRLVAFIMGAVHGINAVLVLAIALHVLRAGAFTERAALVTAALVIGVSGAGFISLLGTTTNDLLNSIFVLGALLGVLKAAEPGNRHGAWRSFAWPGLLAGIGVGLKYTALIYAPGLFVIAVIAAFRRKTVAGLVAFAAAAVLGALAVAGHHAWTLWSAFGNPVFPFLNDIFRSPWYEPQSLRDARFVPRDVWQFLTYPFDWATVNEYLVSEKPLRDWRGAIAYVAIAAGFLAFALGRAHPDRRRHGAGGQTRGLGLVFIFVVVSYVAWALGFGIYRYAVALEMLTGVVTMGALLMLTGVVTMGALLWLLETRTPRIAAATALVAIAAATTIHPDWGRAQYADRTIAVSVPQLPKNSVVLVATWDPVAYFIPFAEPTAQFLGIENNYLELSQNNNLASEVKRIMRTPGRPKFVLNVGDLDGNALNGLLQQFDLRLRASSCRPIWSNLQVHALSLCAVADPAERIGASIAANSD